MRADDVTISLIGGQALTTLRRDLGPTAWIVYEELLLDSILDESGHRVAARSVRSVAVSLGLAKDTVARAIHHLRSSGLVVAVQVRSARGAFDAGTYRLGCVECVQVVAQPSPSSRVCQAEAAVVASQLSFPVEG